MLKPPRTLRPTQPRVHPEKVSHLTALVADPKLDSRKQTARLVAHLGVKTVHETSVDSHLPERIEWTAPDVLITDWSCETVKLVAAMRRIRSPGFPRNEIPVLAIAPPLTATGVRALLATGVNSIMMRPLSPAALFGYLYQAVSEKRTFIKTAEYFGPAHPNVLEDPASFIRTLRKHADDPRGAYKAARGAW